jgi:hypothetical protein
MAGNNSYKYISSTGDNSPEYLTCYANLNTCQTNLGLCNDSENNKTIVNNQIDAQINTLNGKIEECRKKNPLPSIFSTTLIIIIIVCVISIVINLILKSLAGSTPTMDTNVSY